MYVCSTLLHQYKNKTKLISGFYVASVTGKKYLKLPESFVYPQVFFYGTHFLDGGGEVPIKQKP